MKTITLLAALTATTLSSSAATFIVTGGTTSVDLDDATLASIGWSVTGASNTVTPAAGFDVGFEILGSSDFSYEDSPFSINGGNIFHVGTVSLSSDGTSVPAMTVSVGDFTIDSSLNVIDTATTSAALFTASAQSVQTPSPGALIVSGDLLISDALSNVLVGDSSLSGADAGDFQVNAVPETSSAALAGLGMLGLALRRRRG